MGRRASSVLAAVICFTCTFAILPRVAWAQGTSAASIAGVVKDTSGAVLPGVTVEAASPALIEKVRTTVTDEKGEYRIIELRPGAYSVTFTLLGFSTLKRDGLELPPSFTATLNVELKVGELQETVTVSGQTPLIDVQNLTQQKTVSKDLLDAVPTAKSMLGIAALMPSVVEPPNAQDVGGSKGERSVRLSVHGSKTFDSRLLQDGMRYNALTPGIGQPLAPTSNLEGTGRGYYINPLAAQEIVIDIGSMGSAQYEYGGAQVNSIPRDGGNRLTGSFFVGGTGHQLQGNNLTSDLQAQGLTSVNTVRQVYDFNAAVGGPIKQDRVWFYASARRWGTTTSAANLYADANIGRAPGAAASTWKYAPDLSNPIYPAEIDKAAGGRITVQATSKDKFTFSYDSQKNMQDQLTGQLETGTIKNEGNAGYCQRHDVTQGTWTRPASSKLLFDAGVTVSRFNFSQFGEDLFLSDFVRCGGALPDNVSINDTGFGYTYNGSGNRALSLSHQSNGRFNVSYVAGSHNVKTGVFWMYGLGGGHRTYTSRTPAQVSGLPVAYTFNNGVPTSITQYAAPTLTIDQLNPDLGLFVQDQWRVNRFTVNAGLRFDWLRESVPAITEPAGPLVASRSFPARDNVPNWKDLNPRLGVVWDPIGDGKTAIKAGVNRYVLSNTTGIANAFDYANAAVNSTTRSWTDTNGNFLPDCDLTNKATNGECGPLANQNFGSFVSTTNPDPNWITGRGKRPYSWQTSFSFDREVITGVEVSGGYYRTWFGNFYVIQNLTNSSSDWSQFCVTAPTDSRLPANISGQQICGLWDINPDKFGQVNNLVTSASNFGKQTEIYNGADVSVSARIRQKLTLGGGWNIGDAVQTGTTAGGTASARTNQCYVVNSPQQVYPAPAGTAQTPAGYCAVDIPYQSRFKLNASYLLPYDVQVAAVIQSNPGPSYNANVTYSGIAGTPLAASLGRPLAGGTRTVLINIVPPFSQYGPRINQFDVRATKIIRIGNRRLQANVDLYNALNSSAVVNYISTYNTANPALWLQPTQILDARLVKFSLQLDF